MIFKRIEASRPYPEPDLTDSEWDVLPLRDFDFSELIAIERTIDADLLLDTTGLGEENGLRVVEHLGELYLETGQHLALRAALQLRTCLPARVLVVK